jgi:Protein of unknown function (DUF4242)
MGPCRHVAIKWHVRAKLQRFATDTFGSRISPQPEVPVKKYVIERPIPGVGSLTRDELHAASTRSCIALDELGPDIQWVQSFVTDDKIYCVYLAANEELVHQHAQRARFPAVNVAAVRALIDPTMRTDVPAGIA